MLAAAVVLAPSIAVAQTTDPHAIFEQRCSRCHTGHAGPFARQRMIEREGRLQGAESSREIAALLVDRHARVELAPPQIEALVGLFREAVRSGGVYERKCKGCHDRAVVFARRTLIVRDGKLIGRLSRREVAPFMERHGGLGAAEIEVVLAALRRHLETAAREP